MKNVLSVILASFFVFGGIKIAKADEGMWLPLLLNDYNYAEMKRLGLKLTPEQIYSINNSSVKDAIVQLGGFCTAEVVSSKGLLFTNHHCAYDAIQEHSTVEHDYLTDGFWAADHSKELNVPGLSVTFLVRVEDVSERMLGVANAEDADAMKVRGETQIIAQEATAGTKYRAEVKRMFDGNAYYLFVYETYTDIRLVGAPPSSIGKFGGDTDNWMWPRHTGDFSVLRIYADKDNKPADYSLDNKPFTPKHVLPVSLKGVKDGDFTMIMGYPGSTDRYFTSFEVSEQQNILAPAVVKIMGERLEIMKGEMDKDAATRIMLASNYASLNNTYKYFKGNKNSLDKFDLASAKKKEEQKFQKWADSEKKRKSAYGTVLKELSELIQGHAEDAEFSYNMNFAAFAPGFISRGSQMWRLKMVIEDNEDAASSIVKSNLEKIDESFKEYSASADEKIFAMAVRFLNDMPEGKRPDFFQSKLWEKAKGTNLKEKSISYAAKVFKKSILTDKARFEKFLNKPKAKTLEKDAGVAYMESIISLFRQNMAAGGGYSEKLSELRKTYMKGMMEMNPKVQFYPDANSTMRLTYGTVGNYKSWEGKPYKTQTYAKEILKKEIPNDQEFHVPSKLHDLIEKKDYGQYGEKGKLPVCFLHNTDITGGNSGSPVINGNGELIGIAFDGNWESMMSDLEFQEEYVRTISVDIRYVLFVIDKYADARHLINELTLVK